MHSELILASASPRRSELLGGLGYRFAVHPAHIDETPGADETARSHVERLAREKARTVAQSHPQAVVLAADTIVVLGARILGKPLDDADAVAMLRALSGSTHEVMTAVAVCAGKREEAFVQVSAVQFRELDETDIDRYVASGECRDKAGAYGIQGGAARFVEHLSGSYTGVMGLPLCQTEQLLRRFGCGPEVP